MEGWTARYSVKLLINLDISFGKSVILTYFRGLLDVAAFF